MTRAIGGTFALARVSSEGAGSIRWASSYYFFDKKSIKWGARWAEFIERGLESAAFLISILTPSFFRSDHCREEYKLFSATEKRFGRKDLVLPIYYVRCNEIERRIVDDDIVGDILSRQYRDWRALRHQHWDNSDVRRSVSDLADSVAQVYFDLNDTLALNENDRRVKIVSDQKRQSMIADILTRGINYENVVLYAFEKWPDRPISRRHAIELSTQLNGSRYATIADIDREVQYAKLRVDEYVSSHPEKFKYSTDFITKTLYFVDSEYRSKHPVSSSTKNAAAKAGITRY